MRTPDQIAEKSESSIKSQGMIPPCGIAVGVNRHLDASTMILARFFGSNQTMQSAYFIVVLCVSGQCDKEGFVRAPRVRSSGALHTVLTRCLAVTILLHKAPIC